MIHPFREQEVTHLLKDWRQGTWQKGIRRNVESTKCHRAKGNKTGGFKEVIYIREIRVRIHNTLLPLSLFNGKNKLVCLPLAGNSSLVLCMWGKARSSSYSGAPYSSSALLASVRLFERLARNKHSSLLGPFISCEEISDLNKATVLCVNKLL